MTYFDLTFAYVWKEVSNFFILHADMLVSAPLVAKIILAPLNYLDMLLKINCKCEGLVLDFQLESIDLKNKE